jgi:hypothetical protein
MTKFSWGVPRLLCAVGLLVVLSSRVDAQQSASANNGHGRREVDAARLGAAERIVLDGRLDEEVWSRAVPAADFIQIDPQNGRPATEPTEVRIAFGENALYMGVTCYDSAPDEWLGFQRGRDQFLLGDDRFMWTIDTFLDAQTGYFFEMNPSGLMADSLFNVNSDNRAWDGIWDARVRRSEIGWTIEIEIPFRTLNFNPTSDTWGINFQRTVRRKNEDSIWTGWARNEGLRRMTNAGLVHGIRDVTQGHGLDIKPYGLLQSQSAPGRGQKGMDSEADAGVDLFYNLTPGIRANVTVNTDFAQTEVDQRQLNLSRFSLFFPERRGFFLDGATFFDFGTLGGGGGLGAPAAVTLFGGGGDVTSPIYPFFTRRIGLSDAGTPQKIDFGTKVMGQVGRQDVGLLHVRTGHDGDLIGEDFTVARVKRRVFQQSYVGMFYSRRDARTAASEASHTAGVDFRLAATQFLGRSQNISLQGYALHATRPGISDRNNTFGLNLEYPNDRWSAGFSTRQVERNFDPAIGFVARTDYRRYHPKLGFGPRPRRSRYIRRLDFGIDSEILTDLDNRLLERSFRLTLLNVLLQSQDTFGVELTPSTERLDASFAIAPGITLPLGAKYAFTRVAIGGQTANHRLFALGARYETGGFYSGNRQRVVMSLAARLGPGYIVSFNGESNRVDLAEGEFTSSVYRVVAETQFSPFVALVNNVQFDTVSRVAGLQSRFRWIMRPGTDLYVVYTHNWLDDPLQGRFATLDRQLASKVLYTYRF